MIDPHILAADSSGMNLALLIILEDGGTSTSNTTSTTARKSSRGRISCGNFGFHAISSGSSKASRRVLQVQANARFPYSVHEKWVVKEPVCRSFCSETPPAPGSQMHWMLEQMSERTHDTGSCGESPAGSTFILQTLLVLGLYHHEIRGTSSPPRLIVVCVIYGCCGGFDSRISYLFVCHIRCTLHAL
jgi:hypothetical protein